MIKTQEKPHIEAVSLKCAVFDLVEAMHAPHFLLIFKISEVRHLGVSAFSGRQKRFFVVTAKGQIPVYSV